MKNIRRFLLFSIITIVFMLIAFININAIPVSGEIGYKEYDGDTLKINGATFRTDERLEEKDLSFGVKYFNDSIFVSTTLQERMTEYALGGSTYGTVPFIMNQEYSGKCYGLEIPVNTGVEVVPWALVRNGAWQLATVKAIAEDFEYHYPEYKVIAAINGSFFDISSSDNYNHTSSGALTVFGENYKLTVNGDQIGFTNDGSANSIVEQNSYDREARPYISIYDHDDNIIYRCVVEKTNEEPGENETSVFYGIFNTMHKCDGIDVSDAYVVDGIDAYTVSYDENHFYGRGLITKITSMTLGQNQFGIKTNNNELKSYLKIGIKVRIQYESNNIKNGADNSIYYVDRLVKDGVSQDSVADEGVLSAYSQYRYPRTLVGKREDGTIIMTVTDGRQASKGLYGMNGTESAAEMIYYGCTEAWCFDGGGSSSMAVLVDGELQYVNSPSDGNQRADGNAMLVVVKVPELSIGAYSSETSMSFVVSVDKEIEKYKDLYITIDDDFDKIQKIGETVNRFEFLEIFTKHKYTIYAKVNGEFVKMPYEGVFNTSKHRIEIDKLILKEDDNNYILECSYSDDDLALSTLACVVKNKRYYLKDNKIIIPKTTKSPLSSSSYIAITYDLNDLMGKKNPQTDELCVNAKVESSSIMLDAITGEVASILSGLFD